MRALLILLLTALGCTSSPLPATSSAQASNTDNVVRDACPTTIDAYCSDGTCAWMVKRIPAPAAWCATSANATAQLSTCGAFVNVSVYDGDQAIEVYYDADGAPVALALWASDPPCEGSCKLTCLAGPADFVPPAASSCTRPVPVSVCGS